MSTLLLRLAGPMQSWGISSNYNIRRAGTEPSKSAVIGMIASALGRKREDPIEDLSRLRFGFRADQPGEMQKDFQTVKVKGLTNKIVTNRYYLSDAIFLAGIESEDDGFLKQIENALKNPVFHIYLGRKSYPPTLPLVLGVRQQPLEEALKSEPWLVPDWRQKKESSRLRIVVDSFDRYTSISSDLPISFDSKKRLYGSRFTRQFTTEVEKMFLNTRGLPLDIKKEPSTEHDAFSEIDTP